MMLLVERPCLCRSKCSHNLCVTYLLLASKMANETPWSNHVENVIIIVIGCHVMSFRSNIFCNLSKANRYYSNHMWYLCLKISLKSNC